MDHLFDPSSPMAQQQRQHHHHHQQHQQQEQLFYDPSDLAMNLRLQAQQSLIRLLRGDPPQQEDRFPEVVHLCQQLQSQITHLNMHISLLWSYIKRFPGMAMPVTSFPRMAMPTTSFPGMAVPGTRECFDVRLAGMEGSLDIARGESPILGLVESSRTRFPGQGSSSSMNLNLNPNSSMFCTNHQCGNNHEPSVLGMPRDERAYLPLQMINEKDLRVKNATFDEIKGHIAELMESPYGNNYVKELFDRCENNQKDQLVREVTGNAFVFAKLCFDTHGVFSVKQMLKSVADPAQITLIFKALKPLVYRLMTNTNAAEHVIETCVGNHPVEFRKYLLDEIVKHFVSISKDRYGCNSVQQCVTLAQGETRDCLISAALWNLLFLVQDEYGHHVVAWLLQTGLPHVSDVIFEQFKGSFVLLYMRRFSHNVVKLLMQNLSREKLEEVKEESNEGPHGIPLLAYIYALMEDM